MCINHCLSNPKSMFWLLKKKVNVSNFKQLKVQIAKRLQTFNENNKTKKTAEFEHKKH